MKKALASITVLMITALLGGCSANSGPSNIAINSAINASTKNVLQVAGMAHSWQTVEIKNSTVQILRQGNYNEAQKYWPVQATVSGTARQEPEFYWGTPKPSRNCQFSFSTEFKIKRDDYGQWIAVPPPFGGAPVQMNCQK